MDLSSHNSSKPARKPTTIKHALSALLGAAGTGNVQQPPPTKTTTRRRNSTINMAPKIHVTIDNPLPSHPNYPNQQFVEKRDRRHSTNSIRSSPVKLNINSYPNSLGNHETLYEGKRNSITSIDSSALHSDVSTLDGFDTERFHLQNNTSSPPDDDLDTFSKDFLSEYLMERGFASPATLMTKDHIKLSVATSGECVFLPTMSSNEDEYLARLHGLGDEDGDYQAEFGVDTHRGNPNSTDNGSQRGQASINSDNQSARSQPSLYTNTSDMRRPSTLNQRHNTNTNASQNISHTSQSSIATGNQTIEVDDSMTPHSIALIVSLNKESKLSDIRVELCSRVRIYWHDGVPPTKTFKEEVYNAGSMNWMLNSENFNLYIPLNVTSDEKIIENNIDLRRTKLFKNDEENDILYVDKLKTKQNMLKKLDTATSQVLHAGDYVFVIPIIFSNHVPESIYLPSARVGYRICVALKCLQTNDGPEQAAQLCKIATNTSSKSTETEASQTHKTLGNMLFQKVKKQLHIPSSSKEDDPKNGLYVEYPVNIVRTPPSVSISTANKSVYINRVWSDSLSYEISFGQKYVPLNSKFPIKIKLAPLIKNISVKRIRVSVVEKITFVSKNLEYEYDQIDIVAKDPYNPFYMDFQSKRRKDRNLSLLEIRTKDKGSRSVREEIVDNCINDNLLSYNIIKKEGKNKKHEEIVGFNEPVTIISNIEFPKYMDLDQKSAKVIPPYGIDIYGLERSTETNDKDSTAHKSGVIGFFSSRRASLSSKHSDNQQPVDSKFQETKFYTNADVPVKFHTRLNTAKRGLYLDSLHFSNIHSRHKLEIMFRICKPDAEDETRMRNYEVLIDIPIFLVSELCNTGNLELPTYKLAIAEPQMPQEMAMSSPPTFEEAISVPSLPINSPVMSPIGSPNIASSPYVDDSSIQQLCLSRTSSIGGLLSNNRSSRSREASIVNPAASVVAHNDADHRYSNLDGLLVDKNPIQLYNGDLGPNGNSNENGSNSNLFKRGYSLYNISSNENAIHDNPSMSGSNSDDDSFWEKEVACEPPKYDDVVPLMSDEEI